MLYVSVPVLRSEIADYVQYWNSHLMRRDKERQTPSRVPNEMYEMPELYGNVNVLPTGPTVYQKIATYNVGHGDAATCKIQFLKQSTMPAS